MKILLATFRVKHSGAGIPSYNQELIRLLGKTDEISVLGETDEGDVPGCVGSFTTFGHSIDDFAYCSRLVECINRAEYDCVIGSGSTFLPVIAPFLKAPVVSVSHFVNGKFAKIAGYNSDYQNVHIALSNYGKDFLVKKFKIDNPDKVKVIYNFVNKSDYKPEDKVARKGAFKIVYPGGTGIEKSVDVIQKLVYRLLATDLDFEFYWLGITAPLPGDKYTLIGLKKTTDLFPDDKRLKIMGLVAREEAEKILMNSNVFLLPSRGEGCPMTLLEALRGGCIAVVSDARHGSRELIEASGTGFVIRQGDDKKLAGLIEEIIQNHSNYSGQYEKSKSFLESNLSEEVWAKSMADAIKLAMDSEKKYIPFTKSDFRKSVKGIKRILRYEKIRDKMRNGWYRIVIDSTFLRYKMGGIGKRKKNSHLKSVKEIDV